MKSQNFFPHSINFHKRLGENTDTLCQSDTTGDSDTPSVQNLRRLWEAISAKR